MKKITKLYLFSTLFVNYVKSLPSLVICFPRETKDYVEFCNIIKPDAISIDIM